MKIRNVLITTVLSALLLGTTAFAGMPEMALGETGEWPRAMQMRLRALEFTLISDDGEYGEVTAEVLKQFQASAGLTVDGQLGAETIDALYRETIDMETDAGVYTIKLTAPYENFAEQENGKVIMEHGKSKCEISLIDYNSLDESINNVTVNAEKQRVNLASKGIETWNNAIETNYVQINEHDAAIVRQTYEYVKDEVSMLTYRWFTLLPASDTKLFLVKTGFTAPYETALTYLDTIYSSNTGVEVCENIHGGIFSDAPALAEVDFEVMAEDAAFTDTLPLIMQYVDAADNSSDAAMYYGGRLATLYRSYAGLEDPELRYSTIKMSATLLGFDHPDLYEQSDVLREKINTCITALEREDAQERLTSMGMSDIEYTDIENLRNEAVDAVMAGIEESASGEQAGN